jgi:hemolysin activation/secretion protein
LSAELRHTLQGNEYGQWQAIAFLDSQHVTINQTAFAAGTNRATLSGAGVGLNWAGPNRWRATASVATPIGATPEVVGSTASTHVWLQLSKGF